jgi:hypothetical protein
MRQLLFLPLLMLLLFSCGQNKMDSSDDLSSMTFSIDTVVVDAGEDIINLRGGLWNSTFSSDYNRLYLWDESSTTLKVIDLDGLRLEEKIQFEKEGPDGVGTYVSWLNMTDESSILIGSMEKTGLFNLSGKRLREYDFEKEDFSGEELKGKYLQGKGHLSEEGNVFTGLYRNWDNEKSGVIKTDFINKSRTTFEFEGIEELPDYSIALKTDQMTAFMPSEKMVSQFGDKLLFSASAYNTMYSIDLKTGRVLRIDYDPKLSAKGKAKSQSEEVDSNEKFKEKLRENYRGINFMAPIWDKDNKRFYRFSFETTPSTATDTPLFESPDQMVITRIILSVFDENFNLIGESEVPEMTKVPKTAFVKDGKIWIYVNVDDELGFARLTIN